MTKIALLRMVIKATAQISKEADCMQILSWYSEAEKICFAGAEDGAKLYIPAAANDPSRHSQLNPS